LIADPFLQSFEWRTVRMHVLKRDGAKCACCGATAANGVVMNVDHIKPRRTHPELALTESNLQVLCEACNHGKGNWDSTDWRGAVATHAPAGIAALQRSVPGPYLALIRYLLLRPSLALEFRECPPRFASREALALDALLAHLLTSGAAFDAPTTDAIVEAMESTEFGAVYRNMFRLIRDLGDTGEDEAAFRDALKQYRDFESKFAAKTPNSIES